MSRGFPGGSVVKNPPAMQESQKTQVRSPGEGNGNTLHYSCLENFMDTGAWWATVWGGNKLGHDLATKQQQQRWVEKFFIFPRADSTSKAHLQKEKLM